MAETKQRVSDEPTPWRLKCPIHGGVFLTEDEYVRQLEMPNRRWCCPKCGRLAAWDDANFKEQTGVSAGE